MWTRLTFIRELYFQLYFFHLSFQMEKECTVSNAAVVYVLRGKKNSRITSILTELQFLASH